jgi:hypothetical protein
MVFQLFRIGDIFGLGSGGGSPYCAIILDYRFGDLTLSRAGLAQFHRR